MQRLPEKLQIIKASILIKQVIVAKVHFLLVLKEKGVKD